LKFRNACLIISHLICFSSISSWIRIWTFSSS